MVAHNHVNTGRVALDKWQPHHAKMSFTQSLALLTLKDRPDYCACGGVCRGGCRGNAAAISPPLVRGAQEEGYQLGQQFKSDNVTATH